MFVSCTRFSGAANSINIRFIIFDCYVKRELKSFISPRGVSISFSSLSFHLIKLLVEVENGVNIV